MNGIRNQSVIMQQKLQHDSVIAHVISMIGGEDDDRLFSLPDLVQHGDHAGDLVINHRDHSVGQSNDCFRLFFADRKWPLVRSDRASFL